MTSGVKVRPALPSEIDQLVNVELESWGEKLAFTREHFESQFNIMYNYNFQEGIQVAVVDGKICGVGVAQIMRYNLSRPISTWMEATSGGFLTSTFDITGNALYGVSLSVMPGYSHKKVGFSIIQVALQITKKRNLDYFVLCSRVPRFYRYSDNYTIEQYVYQKRGSRYIDPEIEFYSKCGLHIYRILPNYFEDPDSKNYGVLMVWFNF